jgi:hypothetical protein
MASEVFNVAKGRVVELVNRVKIGDPATSRLTVVALKVASADATLRDIDTLALILSGGSTECDFTNYARKTLAAADITAMTPDDANDWQVADTIDILWTAAGGATNNNLVKLVFCYNPTAGADSTLVPLTHHDFALTTNGTDLTATVTNFFKAT